MYLTISSTLIPILICIILQIFHFREKKEIIFVILAILAISIRQNIYLLADNPDSIKIFTILFLNTDPFTTLIGPFVFLYLKITLEGTYIFKPKHLFFLLPSVFCLINLIPYYLMDSENKLILIGEFIKFKNHRNIHFPFLILNLSYQRFLMPVWTITGLSIGLYYLIQKRNSNLPKKQISMIDGFIIIISVYILAIALLFVRRLIDSQSNTYEHLINSPFRQNTPIKTYLNFLIQVFPLFYFLFPNWLYAGKQNSIYKEILNSLRFPFFSKTLFTEENVSSKLEDKVKILKFIEEQKPYLKSDFSVHEISRILDIPHHRISQCFKNEIKVAFPEYRNRLRIAYSIELLKNEKYKTMSIEGIANQSGFKTKTSFYASFKAEYKMTPTEWIEKNL